MPLTKPELATQIQTTTAKFDDPIIEINSALAGANTDDLGILMNRGTTGDHVGIIWDRTAGAFALIETTSDGDASGDITFSAFADLQVKTLTTENFNFPAADGTNGQVLTTNGTGTVTWEDGGGGAGEWTVSGTDLLQVTTALTDVYFTDAITDATPLAQTLHAQGGTGTDIAGAALTIASGIGTGTGVGGSLIFQTAEKGTTSSTPNTLTDRMLIDEQGNIGFSMTQRTDLYDQGIWMGVGPTSQITAQDFTGGNHWLEFTTNTYYSGGYKYVDAGDSMILQMYNGNLWIAYAASGTADAAASYTTAFNIYNTGLSVAGSVIDTDTTLAANSSVKLVTQNAVKTYVDNAVPAALWNDESIGISSTQSVRIGSAGNSSGLLLLEHATSQAAMHFKDQYDAQGGSSIIHNNTALTINCPEALGLVLRGNSGNIYLNAPDQFSTSIVVGNSTLDGTWGTYRNVMQFGGEPSCISSENAGNLYITQGAYNATAGWKHLYASTCSKVEFDNRTTLFSFSTVDTSDTATVWVETLILGTYGHAAFGQAAIAPWHTDLTAIDVGGLGSLSATTATASGEFQLSRNAYYDLAQSRWEYVAAEEAQQIDFTSTGTIEFRVAVTGSVAGAITWVDALTIDNTGHLNIEISGAAATPSLTFNDTDTGFWGDTNIINISNAGAQTYQITATGIFGVTTGSGRIANAAGSSTVPTIMFNGDPDTGLGRSAADVMHLITSGASAVEIDANQNVALGTAALATTATDGFLYVPSCAGVPTGTPTTKTGRVALIFDTTNNDLYVYDGSWISIALV